MALKECYSCVFNRKKLKTLAVRLILEHMTQKCFSDESEQRTIATIDEHDKNTRDYVIKYKNKYNLKQGNSGMYFGPAQIKDEQIPSLCLGMVHTTLIPIKLSIK